MIPSFDVGFLVEQNIRTLCLCERRGQINPRTQHAHHKRSVYIVTQIDPARTALFIGNRAN